MYGNLHKFLNLVRIWFISYVHTFLFSIIAFHKINEAIHLVIKVQTVELEGVRRGIEKEKKKNNIHKRCAYCAHSISYYLHNQQNCEKATEIKKKQKTFSLGAVGTIDCLSLTKRQFSVGCCLHA